MAVYQVETAGGNLPARISLMRMPDRVELRQKNLFSVADVQMFWHPQGDYLAVQVRCIGRPPHAVAIHSVHTLGRVKGV